MAQVPRRPVININSGKFHTGTKLLLRILKDTSNSPLTKILDRGVLVEAMNWALIALSGNANLELALAGIDMARHPLDLDKDNESPAIPPQKPETIPLNYPFSDSEIEDDGSPALKIFYESIPGSPWRSL